MTFKRADAHLHFFKPGFIGQLPENCRRIQPDEFTIYQSLAKQYNVEQCMVVGYEGEDWAAGNNQQIADIAAEHAWVRPLWFCAKPLDLSIEKLESLASQRFVGLSMYLFDDNLLDAVNQIDDTIWNWITEQHWLISINSRAPYIERWYPILDRHPNLRLIVSHLGLPPAMAQAPSSETARQALASLLGLAKYPGPHVKLSGFYALADPGYQYPHQPAWPYVQEALNAFGPDRLIWGSDFSPSLEWLSFPQTFALFEQMPFMDEETNRKIQGGNLLRLLNEVGS
jgi:L-fuconolactonase